MGNIKTQLLFIIIGYLNTEANCFDFNADRAQTR